jgi:hypothetical protein
MAARFAADYTAVAGRTPHHGCADRRPYRRRRYRRGGFHHGRIRDSALADRRAAEVPSGASHLWPGLPESARQFRIFGWAFVALLYLVAVFCLLQGVNDLRVVRHWAQWDAVFGTVLSEPAEITLYADFWIAMAIALCLVAYWAQRRLRRRC